MQFVASLPSSLRTELFLFVFGAPDGRGSRDTVGLTLRHASGVTITQGWTTSSLLDTKVELAEAIAPGVKVDLQNLWNPSKANSAAQKINLAF